LKQFKADATFKTAAYSFIASQCLSKKERDAFAMAFRSFDKNSTGTLTLQELKEAYKENKVQIEDLELELVFRSID